MADNTNRLNTQLNFAIPTTQEERDKIIFLAVKTLTEKEGGNITLNQILSYVDDNLNNLSDEVAKALINKSNNGHTHDDRYYTEDEINTKVNQLNSDLNNNVNELNNTLVAKTSMLSYEEIMASTPPLDLNVGIPKASALKDSIKNRPLASYYYRNISNANRDDAFLAIKELRTLTRECFNRGSIVHILNNTDGYHTYLIGSTDPDYFMVLALSYYNSDFRPEVYRYSNGTWTRWYLNITRF